MAMYDHVCQDKNNSKDANETIQKYTLKLLISLISLSSIMIETQLLINSSLTYFLAPTGTKQ